MVVRKGKLWWLMAAGREKSWYERGNSGGSWPPAFPCSPNQLQNLNSKINFFGSNILFSSVFDLEGFVLADVGYFSVKIYFFIFRKKNLFYTVKPLIRNTSEEFIKCRLDNFSMSFILYYVNFSICENK